MTYQIEISPAVQKWMIKKLNKEQIRRLSNKIKKLEEFPDSHGKPLRYPLAGVWEFYFERKFRVLYRINYESKLVKIIAIKHKDEM